MSKCPKTREIIAIYTKHLCRGENCNHNICCELCCWSGISALAELDAMEEEVSMWREKYFDHQHEKGLEIMDLGMTIEKLEAKYKRYREALELIGNVSKCCNPVSVASKALKETEK